MRSIEITCLNMHCKYCNIYQFKKNQKKICENIYLLSINFQFTNVNRKLAIRIFMNPFRSWTTITNQPTNQPSPFRNVVTFFFGGCFSFLFLNFYLCSFSMGMTAATNQFYLFTNQKKKKK